MIDSEKSDMLRAVSTVLRQALSEIKPGASRLELPAPVVRNIVQPADVHVTAAVASPKVEVTNHVDVPSVENHVHVEKPQVHVAAPVVNVTVDMQPVADAIDRQSAVLARLLDAVAAIKPVVTVQPAAVTVNVPERPKRTITVKHPSGQISTIREE